MFFWLSDDVEIRTSDLQGTILAPRSLVVSRSDEIDITSSALILRSVDQVGSS